MRRARGERFVDLLPTYQRERQTLGLANIDCWKHISQEKGFLGYFIVENIHISALRGVIKAFTGSIAYCSICSAHNKFADKIQVVWITGFENVVQLFKEHHNFYWKRESKTEDKIYAHIYLFLDSSVHFRFVRDLSVQILIPPQIFWKHPFCDDVDWVFHQVLSHLFYLFFPFTVVSMIILFCKKGLIFSALCTLTKIPKHLLWVDIYSPDS